MQASVNNRRGLERMYTIYIRPPSNMGLNVVGIEVTDSVKIYNVKKQVEEKTGIAVNKQQIMYSGKELQNSHTVGDYVLKHSAPSILRIKPNVNNGRGRGANNGRGRGAARPRTNNGRGRGANNGRGRGANNRRGLERMYTIYIRPPSNMGLNVVGIEVTDSVKIYNVKKQVEEKTGIAVNKQQIMYSGKELQNSHTVGDYVLKHSAPSILRIKPNVNNGRGRGANNGRGRGAARPRTNNGRGLAAPLSPNLINSNKVRNFKQILNDNRSNNIIKSEIIQYAQSKGITNINRAIEGYTNQELRKQFAAAELK